jgi:hypothetical protein
VGGSTVDYTVGVASRGATFHTDGSQLHDFVGGGHQFGHWPKGLAAKILVEASTDNIFAFVRKFDRQFDDRVIKKLRFFDENHLSIREQFAPQLQYRIDWRRIMLDSHVADNIRFVVTLVHGRFEDLDPPLSVERTTRQANQLFTLAGKHAAADHGELSKRFHALFIVLRFS